MSDFLIYAARLQDAGVKHLSVRIWTGPDRMRMMRVTPGGLHPQEIHQRFPWRDFELCGTDPVLRRLKDDMIYSDDGVTAEKVQAAIAKHPLLRDDLCEFLSDWMLTRGEENEKSEGVTAEDEAAGERMAFKVKAVLHGISIARKRDAMKTPNAK